MGWKRSDIDTVELLEALIAAEDANHPLSCNGSFLLWACDYYLGGTVPDKVMIAKLTQLAKLGLWSCNNNYSGWVTEAGRALVMGKNTKIAWCDHTWNPWRGCERVSEGCEHCYAEQGAKRFPKVMGVWGSKKDGGTRPGASERYMRQLADWNREAGEAQSEWHDAPPGAKPHRPRVFVGSVMDFFEDNRDVRDVRARAWNLMLSCQSLTHMLLTKRPQNIAKMLPANFSFNTSTDGEILPFPLVSHCWRHVWLGCTVENQARADERIPIMLDLPRGGVRWLSVEPLLESIDLTKYLATGQIDWVVVGGESMQGGKCRGFNAEWAEEVVVQCDAYKVPVFVKQLGGRPYYQADHEMVSIGLKSKAGTDPGEWPEWLRRQEFPGDPV